MKLTITPDIVILDGVPVQFDLSGLIAADIHAVQWDGTKGHVEYKGHYKPNKEIKDIKDFQPVIDAYYVAKDEQEQAALDEAAAREAAKTYKDRRREEYPPIGDQLDIIWKVLDVSGDTEAQAMKDQIEAIKVKYPKE